MLYNKYLRLDILPTEECNFRCVYCYENFKIKTMDNDTISGIKNLILIRSKTLKILEINWFGGEPMLGYNVIKDIMEYSKELSIRYDFKLISSMTTNGSLLTIKKVKELYELYVRRFQISFDGDKSYHNKFRITREKSNTFDIIYNNVLCLHKSDINSEIIIRLHLNKNNYQSIYNFIKKLSIDINHDDRFKIFIRGLSRLGGVNDETIPVINNKNEIKYLLKKLNYKVKISGLQIYNNNSEMCYAASMSQYLIRSNGYIGKCTVALYNDKNILGKINSDGSLKIDKDKLKYWIRGNFSGDIDELKCPLKQL